jgi:hypothetical protein
MGRRKIDSFACYLILLPLLRCACCPKKQNNSEEHPIYPITRLTGMVTMGFFYEWEREQKRERERARRRRPTSFMYQAEKPAPAKRPTSFIYMAERPAPVAEPMVGSDTIVERLFAQIQRARRKEREAWRKLAMYLAALPAP